MIKGRIPHSYIKNVLTNSKRIIEIHGLMQLFHDACPTANRKVWWSPQAVEDVELTKQFIERTDQEFLVEWLDSLNRGIESVPNHIGDESRVDGFENVYVLHAGYQRVIVEMMDTHTVVHAVV